MLFPPPDIVQFENVMKRLPVPILDNATCVSMMRNENALGPEFELFESYFCGGALQGIGPCMVSGGLIASFIFLKDIFTFTNFQILFVKI